MFGAGFAKESRTGLIRAVRANAPAILVCQRVSSTRKKFAEGTGKSA